MSNRHTSDWTSSVSSILIHWRTRMERCLNSPCFPHSTVSLMQACSPLLLLSPTHLPLSRYCASFFDPCPPASTNSHFKVGTTYDSVWLSESSSINNWRITKTSNFLTSSGVSGRDLEVSLMPRLIAVCCILRSASSPFAPTKAVMISKAATQTMSIRGTQHTPQGV